MLVRKLVEGISLLLRNFTDHPLKGTVALVGFLVAVISLIFGIRELVNWIEGPEYRSNVSRLIIVDVSDSMERSFSPQSKFASVRHEILRYVEDQPNVDVALRFTSKQCDEPYDQPDVDFAHGNEEVIRAKLDSVNLGGKSTFGDAVRVGVNDFIRSKSASSAKVRTIWLLLGTASDDCSSSQSIADNIERALGDSSVDLSWIDFFALKSERRKYNKLAKAIKAALAKKVDVNIVQVASAKVLRGKIQEASRREAPSDH